METQLVMPFIGSELQCSGKEAMTGILFEIMEKRNRKEGEKIYAMEFLETVQLLEKEGKIPTVYKTFPSKCWNSMWEMGDEGLLIIHQKDSTDDAWIKVTNNLTKLVSKETPAEEKKKILALCEQNRLKAEEIKKQKAEQEKIKKPALEKTERQGTPETGIRKYLPKFLK
jgi:hypothetical protein